MSEKIKAQSIPLTNLHLNTGQIKDVPKNPRFIRNERYKALLKSIEDDPEMLNLRELVAYDNNGELVVIMGNMRYRAMKELGFKEALVKVLPRETEAKKLRAYIQKDNIAFGQNDWDLLGNEWDVVELEDFGLEWDVMGKRKEEKHEENTASSNDDDFPDEEGDGEEEKESFYRSMFKDCLYESNNIYDIPNLRLDRQAGKLELPFTPWGANSRLKKDVSTYHFYVDDYRFEALFKDPINLLTSGVKAIVEPNCSLHDQTPIAWGLQLIYKKRWLSRYLQECGVKVYADLNVSHKFIEYNKMGIPKGYNAFFTRATDGWEESMKLDLQVTREISGVETPNLIVYGGGKEAQKFCMDNGLLYVTDFINAKKI